MAEMTASLSVGPMVSQMAEMMAGQMGLQSVGWMVPTLVVKTVDSLASTTASLWVDPTEAR